MRVSRTIGPSLLCLLAFACTKDERKTEQPTAEPPAETASPASTAPTGGAAPVKPTPPGERNDIRATIAGHDLAVASAVYTWNPGSDDLGLAFSDRADLCDVLAAGAMPKDATVLFVTLKHTGKDNRDAPFGAGAYPVRTSAAIVPQDAKGAWFAKLDSMCKPSARESATGGSVELSTSTEGAPGSLEGTLALDFASDQIKGSFVAAHCQLPDDEPGGCQ